MINEQNMCEDVRRKDLTRCTMPAKWLTPAIRKWSTGGKKVCGVHKHRHETALHKCVKL